MLTTYGIERECFITNPLGRIVPSIGLLLTKVHELAEARKIPKKLFSYELFAGQIEDRTPPCSSLKEVEEALILNKHILLEAANELGLSFDFSEIVDVDRITSLEVNPFDIRHKEIWQTISHERKVAASIVAAVHIHISVMEEDVARILNRCRENVIERLVDIGDHSSRRRIDTYRIMSETTGVPPIFSDFASVTKYIATKDGEKNVWDLVRYKPSTGTIEFRMFGTTPRTEEILGYIQSCVDILNNL